MATDGGDNKGPTGSSQHIKDLEVYVTGRPRSSAMTLEHGDRQSIQVRPWKKRNSNMDTNKRVRKRLRRDKEEVGRELVNYTSTCRQPLDNMLQLHTPVWCGALAEGQGSAVLHILVRKVQWENQVFHVLSSIWNQTPLSRRHPRGLNQASLLKRISLQGDTLSAFFEYTDLALGLSSTNSATMTKTSSSCVSEYGVGSRRVFFATGNTFLNSACTVCYPLIIQQSKETSADSQCKEKLQTKIDITNNASVEDADHKHNVDKHLSSGYYFPLCNKKYAREVFIINVDKLICGRSFLDNGQLKTVSETLNATDNGWTLKPISYCRNVRSKTGATSRGGDCNIVKCKRSDKKCNKGDNRSKKSNTYSTSCQIINHKCNRSRKSLSVGSSNSNNENNNSNGHNVDSDGSSDSEIDCTHDGNNVEVNGQSPGISNAVPPREYKTDAEKLQGACMDSVNEHFKHISLDSSGNSTQMQLENGTETSTQVACESVTSANDMGNLKRRIHNRLRELDVSQPIECRGEKLGGVCCESGQEFCVCNQSEVYFHSGQTGVQTRLEMETQNNPEAEDCPIRDKSTDTDVNSSTNQVLQIKENNTVPHDISMFPETKRHSVNQRTCEDSATGANRRPSQVSDDGFKISLQRTENRSPSQENFTENNGILQLTCQDKTVDSCGMTKTEPAKPDRVLRGFNDELESLKCLEGSVHVRQTGQCCLEDIKCVNFLGMLTNKLTEHTIKDASVPNQKRGATSTDKSGHSPPDHVLSDKPLISSAPHNSDKKSAYFCEMTASGIDTPQAHAAKYDQKRRHASIPTTEVSAEVVELEHIEIGVGSLNTIQLSSEQIVSSNVPKKIVLAASTGDTRPGCTEELLVKTPPNSQVAEDRDFCEIWPSKYTVSLSDRFLHKYDLLTMQSKQKYKKSAESSKTGKNDAMRNTNFDFADPAFEVDVFRSMEYATSLSCGLASEKRSCGPVVYEHVNFKGELHDASATQLKENSQADDGQGYHRETVSVKPQEGQKRVSVSLSDENTVSPISEGEAANYSRDRIMRASEQRRKLMTEFEEITSCVDVNNWPRYDKGNFCYQSGNFNHDVDNSLKRQVSDQDSSSQSMGKHMIGTLTIEYLNPPVNGFVFLK